MSQHFPVRIARPQYRQWIFPRTAVRSFSATQAACSKKKARNQADPATAQLHGKQNDSQKAPATIRAEAMRDTKEMRDDLGLLPGTFVRERGAGPPLFPFSSWWKFESTYWKTKAKDLWTMLYFKFFVRKRHRPKEVFWGRRHVRRIARESYVALYEALARKDEKSLEGFCMSGLRSHLQRRFQSRPRDVEMTWKLLKHDPSPRVMSNRFAYYPLPGSDDKITPTCFRQIVLRLKTRQLLTIERKDPSQTLASSCKKSKPLVWKPEGVASESNEAAGGEQGLARYETHEQDVVEYVVLQRRMLKGVEEPWKLWGFTNRTTLAQLLADEKAVDAIERYRQAHPELA